MGSNSSGLLGDPVASDAAAPVLVPGLENVSKVRLGFRRGCAIDGDARLLCWGDNSFGYLGTNDGSDLQDKVAPTVINLPPVDDVSIGVEMTCAHTLDNEVWCWGGNGELGPIVPNGPLTIYQPTKIELDGAKQVVAGYQHFCVLTVDDRVVCRGSPGVPDKDGRLHGELFEVDFGLSR